jgi:putative Mn2+ efflux pump MntP
MDILTLLLIALGLCMDTFAIAISYGMSVKRPSLHFGFKVALSFGVCQAVMPVLGWLAGTSLKNLISAVDHWIAFGLLTLIGVKMIYESFVFAEKTFDVRKTRVLFILALATSIDALAVGLSFALLDFPILTPALVIGSVTFVVSLFGVFVGHKTGKVLGKKAEVLGGLILIGIGTKILFEHLGILK